MSSGRFVGSRGGGRGRGQYYKNKYGSGRRAGGGGGGGGGNSRGGAPVVGGEQSKKYKQDEYHNYNATTNNGGGGSFSDLISLLYSLDNSNYPAYKSIESCEKGWIMDDEQHGFSLFVGRAQSDPYAAPTRCRMVVPNSVASFPKRLHENKIRAVALADFIHRKFYSLCVEIGADKTVSESNHVSGLGSGRGGGGGGGGGRGRGGGWSGPKGGDIAIEPPTQHVIEQSAVWIDSSSGNVVAQFTVNLPARGRTILGRKAVDIFHSTLPTLVKNSLIFNTRDTSSVEAHVYSIEDQHWIRNELKNQGLIAFVRNGACLPRSSGADDKPMNDHKNTDQKIVLFKSPETLEVHFDLPNAKQRISGMGLRSGINLIVGGGFHGKSTLLSALQYGIYDKIPGDGREFCVCDESAVKIRAEDGRSVTSVDISPFISNLPFGKDTRCFTSPDASGSTSQASNIIESLEIGSKVLLLDEDTCATNFMIRDTKMMELVSKKQEPITPFIKKVQSLYKELDVSSILVIGGSGDYFDVASTVIMMNCYECFDVTEKAKMICEKENNNDNKDKSASAGDYCQKEFGSFRNRYPQGRIFHEMNKVSIRSISLIHYGETELDLRYLEQIVSRSQTNTISFALRQICSICTPNKNEQGTRNIKEVVNEIMVLIKNNQRNGGGIDDALAPYSFHGGLGYVRPFEIAFAMNRLRRNGSFIQ